MPIQAFSSEVCDVEIALTPSENSRGWRVVNDGVMGGRSFGDVAFENGRMVFTGVINTDGGGFSSVRTSVPKGSMQQASDIRLKVKSDGRLYQLIVRTNARYYGRRIAFRADIPQTPAGEWRDITVPLRPLEASIFGRSLSGGRFDPSEIKSVGIILADGRDGPFRLVVGRIDVC